MRLMDGFFCKERTGKNMEYHSIPYGSIAHFSTETADSFYFGAEMKIYFSGSSTLRD